MDRIVSVGGMYFDGELEWRDAEGGGGVLLLFEMSLSR